MTEDKQFKANKAAIDAANAVAHNLSKDAGVKGQKVPVEAKAGPHNNEQSRPKTQMNYTPPPNAESQVFMQNFLTSMRSGQNVHRAVFLWE